MRTALIVGATGLVGSFLLPLLLNCGRYSRVIALVRSSAGIEHPLLQEVVADFRHLSALADDLPHLFAVDNVFCCLGTTIKKAGTKQKFREVDYDYPWTIARLCKREGASRFILVSAIGADEKSPFYYSRIKGELEHAILTLQFSTVHIFRPSLLLGDRKDWRLGEWLAGRLAPVFSPLLLGSLSRFRPVPAKFVAQAMVEAANGDGQGVQYYNSQAIVRLALRDR